MSRNRPSQRALQQFSRTGEGNGACRISGFRRTKKQVYGTDFSGMPCSPPKQLHNRTFLHVHRRRPEAACEYDGFLSGIQTRVKSPANYSDLLLERGSKNLSRQWSIPFDTNWTTRFHMAGEGKDDTEYSFYEPWRAGREYADAATKDLGYWSFPFSLEKGSAGSYEMITYSLPLRYEGTVYGVLGVEISSKVLRSYLPAKELNAASQSGYMLAVKEEDGSYRSLIGEGLLSNTVHSARDTFS